jgi:hypothetical protein
MLLPRKITTNVVALRTRTFAGVSAMHEQPEALKPCDSALAIRSLEKIHQAVYLSDLVTKAIAKAPDVHRESGLQPSDAVSAMVAHPTTVE